MKLSPRLKDLIFLALLTVMCVLYFDGLLEKGPFGTHLWRQSDSLSLTQHYAEGAKFLEPEMHILLADDRTTGKTAGEFPGLYYTAGKIWSAFGQSYISYRLFYLFITVISLFLLYKALLLVLKDWFWATFITLLVFTSPSFVIFSTSFITDGPSICFVFIGLYFITRYATDKSLKWFYLAMGFFAFAGLVKVSSLIAFIFLLFIFVIERLPIKSLGNRKLFARPISEGLGFILTLVLISVWYVYADHYYGIHHFKYTFNSIYPMWEVPNANLDKILEGLRNNTIPSFFSSAILLGLLFLGIFNLFLIKRINLFAYSASFIVIIGCVAYFTLWFPLMENHNYYFVILIILVPAIFTPFALFVKNENPSVFSGNLMRVFLGLFLLFNFLYSYQVVQLTTKGKKQNYLFIGNNDIIKRMTWNVTHENRGWNRYEEMKPYLLEIGVSEDAKVISPSDQSFNVSLFLSDRRGWTDYTNLDSAEIQSLIEKGAEYLFVGNDIQLQEEYLQPFIKQEIGNFKGVRIYQLPDLRIPENSNQN